MPSSANKSCARQRAHHPRRIRRRPRHPHRRHQPVAGHRLRHQRIAHRQVRGPDQPHHPRDHQHHHRRQHIQHRQRRHQSRQRGVDKPHRTQDIAMAQPVPGQPEHRCDQRSDILQRAIDGQQQHRSRRRQDVPAEDDALHLAGPGGQQVGGKLEPETAHRERGENGRSAVAALLLHPIGMPGSFGPGNPRGRVSPCDPGITRNGIAYISPPLVHSALGPRSSFSELALPTLRS